MCKLSIDFTHAPAYVHARTHTLTHVITQVKLTVAAGRDETTTNDLEINSLINSLLIRREYIHQNHPEETLPLHHYRNAK